MTQLWPAPHTAESVVAHVWVPGSKSLTNRALVLAALADAPSILRAPLVARDTELMAAALESLGATIDRRTDAWHISPITSYRESNVDCGLAGTVMRFVPLVAALSDQPTHFDGDERAYERPMAATISALRDLGAEVEDAGRNTLPFTVRGTDAVQGGALDVDASASSQFVSALLLIAPKLANGLALRHVGGELPSVPHIDMTVTELRRSGVAVETADAHWRVTPGPIAGLDITIEADLSNAGAFIGAALVTGGRVTIANWPETTDQAGDAWNWLVPAFGGVVERDGDNAIFTGPETLLGITADLHEVGELTPVVAAIAAFANAPSTLTGVAHLRGHETDRLAALTNEFNALGGNVAELADGLHIEPAPLHEGTFHTYDDHRIAHAAVIVALKTPGLLVENIATTAKTYPEFADAWVEMLRS